MAWVNVIDLFYPVGIIIEFVDDTNNPSNIFGGTWVQLTTTSPYRWKRTA